MADAGEEEAKDGVFEDGAVADLEQMADIGNGCFPGRAEMTCVDAAGGFDERQSAATRRRSSSDFTSMVREGTSERASSLTSWRPRRNMHWAGAITPASASRAL